MWAKEQPERYFGDSSRPPGLKAHAAMYLALLPSLPNERQRINYTNPVLDDLLPRWPTPGVDYLMTHCGGGYGLSVVLGGSKCGKTFFALSQCIEAAATMNWQVVYLSAELDMQELAFRVGGYLKAHPHCVDAQNFLHILHVGKGQTPEEVQEDIAMTTDENGPPILVCLDSINTIAQMSGRDYLRTLTDYALWAMVARRMSNGAVSFLIVSETNKLGFAKGGQLQFWADQLIKLEKVDSGSLDSPAGGMTPVKISLLASRRTGGEGPMGIFLRNHKSCQFEKYNPAYKPKLRSVGSKDWRLTE